MPEYYMTDPAAVHVVCPHCEAINRLAPQRLADEPTCGKCKKLLFVAKPLDVTSAQFTRHIERNDIPVVVDFWADWCGPCKAMAPAYQQAAQRLEPAVRLLKVDTEAARSWPRATTSVRSRRWRCSRAGARWRASRGPWTPPPS
jgi:thioredoxin 2